MAPSFGGERERRSSLRDDVEALKADVEALKEAFATPPPRRPRSGEEGGGAPPPAGFGRTAPADPPAGSSDVDASAGPFPAGGRIGGRVTPADPPSDNDDVPPPSPSGGSADGKDELLWLSAVHRLTTKPGEDDAAPLLHADAPIWVWGGREAEGGGRGEGDAAASVEGGDPDGSFRDGDIEGEDLREVEDESRDRGSAADGVAGLGNDGADDEGDVASSSSPAADRRRSRRAEKRRRWRTNRRAAKSGMGGTVARLADAARWLAGRSAGRWRRSVARMTLLGLAVVALLSASLGQGVFVRKEGGIGGGGESPPPLSRIRRHEASILADAFGSETASFHPDWTTLRCKDDPEGHEGLLSDSAVTFETAEDCCEAWFSFRYDDCVSSSTSEHAISSSPVATTDSSESPSSPPGPIFDDAVVSTGAPPAIDAPDTSSSPDPAGTSALPCPSEPESCGCSDVNQKDYRGSISVTKSGHVCQKWDLTAYKPGDSPGAGLEDNNYCRNPDDDSQGAWCVAEEHEDGYEHCDVPICGDSPSDAPKEETPSSPTSFPPWLAACNANPEACNCLDPNNMAAYRGKTRQTRKGVACVAWDAIKTDEGVDYVQAYPNAGLEENYCRVPYQSIGLTPGPWCYTYIDGEVDSDICAIPVCSDPTCDANPDTCGCPNLFGSDYRGVTNKTSGGLPCMRWDLAAGYGPDSFPEAGLEENYCRNPDYDPGGPWCNVNKTVHGGEGYGSCEVPDCSPVPTASPTASAIPTSSSKPTITPTPMSCMQADNETCGCERVSGIDYRGDKSTTSSGLSCQRWDEQTPHEHDYIPIDHSSANLDENYCRNPNPTAVDLPWCYTTDQNLRWEPCDISPCDPCKCMPDCGQPNMESCACPSILQANACCGADESSCKCRYLKEACGKSLENGSTEHCREAEHECCNENTAQNDVEHCLCDMYEEICFENLSSKICRAAAEKCCTAKDLNDVYCLCDSHSYVDSFLSDVSEMRKHNCTAATQVSNRFSKPDEEKKNLKALYDATGGEYWFVNTGWSDDANYCHWYGLKCNGNGVLIEIDLRGNNLTGELIKYLPFPELTKLDLANNTLSGDVETNYFLPLRKLRHVDISQNRFHGHADMLFSPTTLHANFSNNNFKSAGFKRFNSASKTLRVVDLSNNFIDHDTSEFFRNIPPNLEELILSNNLIRGELPNPFTSENLKVFAISSNIINGTLPEFSSRRLQKLYLSNQNDVKGGGLTGPIPADLTKLTDLSVLDLAGNKLTGGIPASIGNLAQLQELDLSSNMLSESIPTTLGRLYMIETIDLSTNRFTGSIPSEFGSFEQASAILLSSNSNITDPAPLDLCFLPGFDLINDTRLCPTERNALNDFYYSTKGDEWTEATHWLDPYQSFCDWHGVTCKVINKQNSTIKLDLHNNGLSGKLGKEIANLTFLEFLDLSDNDIKGEIPPEIGYLTNLEYLRLCYNDFIGTGFERFRHLLSLKLIQVHGNRLTGNITIPDTNSFSHAESSFVSDCGNPSDFDESLACEDCTMCCNAQGDCFPAEENIIQKVRFKDYMSFSGVFLAVIVFASGVLAMIVYCHDKHRNRHLPRSAIRQPEFKDRDKKYALDKIGDDSVYQFFLGTRLSGWAMVLLTLAAQFWLLFVFVKGAEVNWTTDKTDLVYTWKCSRDEAKCKDTSDLDELGWLAFAILMVANVAKDAIDGTKLVMLSGKLRHSPKSRARFFVGGMIMTSVSIFSFYVSAIYNAAIATSNTDIITNSVVIIFICDIDELLYDILVAINEDWVESMSLRQKDGDEDNSLEALSQHESNQNLDTPNQSQVVQNNLEGEVQSLKEALRTLQETVHRQNADLKRLLTMTPGVDQLSFI